MTDVENGQFSKKIKEGYIAKKIDDYFDRIIPEFFDQNLEETQKDSKKIVDYVLKHIL